MVLCVRQHELLVASAVPVSAVHLFTLWTGDSILFYFLFFSAQNIVVPVRQGSRPTRRISADSENEVRKLGVYDSSAICFVFFTP